MTLERMMNEDQVRSISGAKEMSIIVLTQFV